MTGVRPAKIGPYRTAAPPDDGVPAALREHATERLKPYLLNLGSARRNGSAAGYIDALEETLQVALELVGLEP